MLTLDEIIRDLISESRVMLDNWLEEERQLFDPTIGVWLEEESRKLSEILEELSKPLAKAEG